MPNRNRVYGANATGSREDLDAASAESIIPSPNTAIVRNNSATGRYSLIVSRATVDAGHDVGGSSMRTNLTAPFSGGCSEIGRALSFS